jgi:type II secretion system protein H
LTAAGLHAAPLAPILGRSAAGCVPRERLTAGTRPAARTQCGFTLLELMVVVVIIGLVVAGAILSLGATGRDSQLERERDRLTALITYARERGALLTLEYGIRCGQHGYRFVYYDNRTMQWQPETLDDTLRVHQLSDGLDLQLVIEGRDVVLDDQALQLPQNATVTGSGAMAALTGSPGDAANSSTSSFSSNSSGPGAPAQLNAQIAQNAPQIMLLSDGDMNSFALTIERSSAHRSVTLKSVSDGTVSTTDIVQAQQ